MAVGVFRTLSEAERALLKALLMAKSENEYLVAALDGLRVKETDDGGMGSLYLDPIDAKESLRKFGSQIVMARALDTDGIELSIIVNTDEIGRLFELDIWTVDFNPLLRLSTPAEIEIVS
jgi:hypothetical protein